ncbi:MAG TPA: DUF3575 domain-containing protein [Cyclobacteriaceae bacterium]
MKKSLLLGKYFLPLLVILFAFGFNEAKAQSTLKINIISPIVRTINVQFEKTINTSSSFQLGFFYTGASSGGTTFKGFGITPEYRFYLSDSEAPEGVYVAPFVRYQNFKLTEDSFNSEGTYTAVGGGLILGKQWIFKEKIVLDIFLGPSYSSGSIEVTSGTDNFDVGAFDGFGLRTGLCFGIKL